MLDRTKHLLVVCLAGFGAGSLFRDFFNDLVPGYPGLGLIVLFSVSCGVAWAIWRDDDEDP